MNPSEYLEPAFGEAAIQDAIRCAKPSFLNRRLARRERLQEGVLSSMDDVPPRHRGDMEALGFTPLPESRSQFVPPSSAFIGPEEYVQYKVTVGQRNICLRTYFTDGTSLVTAEKPDGSTRTQWLTWKDSFADSYAAHLSACVDKCAGSSTKPLRCVHFEDMVGFSRLGSQAFIPAYLALLVQILP